MRMAALVMIAALAAGLPAGQGAESFESLPAGPYRAEWLSDSGAVLAEAEFSLEAMIDQSLRADR